MKTKVTRALLYLVVIISTISCETQELKNIDIKPNSLSIEGESGKYFEIVDSTYTFKECGKFINGKLNPQRYGHSTKIKIKRTDLDFNFVKDSVNHKEPDRMCLYFELTDTNDNILKNFNVYYSSTVQDFKKLLNAKCGSITEVEFECIFADRKEFLPKLPKGKVRFKTFSTDIRLLSK